MWPCFCCERVDHHCGHREPELVTWLRQLAESERLADRERYTRELARQAPKRDFAQGELFAVPARRRAAR